MDEILRRMILIDDGGREFELRIYTETNGGAEYVASAKFAKFQSAEEFAQRLDALARELHFSVEKRAKESANA